MDPVAPHWSQPSHPDIQEVVFDPKGFMTKSFSKVSVAPFAVFAKMSFPPCAVVSEPSYASVQMDKECHFVLNSDLMYINHSCEPSVIFDTDNLNIIAGPKGLKPGDELTFFYPSTEWEMAQPFDCLCGTPSCKRVIDGAKKMSREQLEGYWLSSHIRELSREHHLL